MAKFWLSNFQVKNAFRSSLLAFVFILENSLMYVSNSLKFTVGPEACRLSRLKERAIPFSSVSPRGKTLYAALFHGHF